MQKKAEILDRAARRAIIKHEVEKTARLKSLSKSVDFDPSKAVNLLGIVAAGIILNQFVKNLIDAGNRAAINMKEPSYYEKMLRANPGLLDEDEETIAKLWGTLYRTAPQLAQDPVAAGGFITQNLKAGVVENYGGPTIDTYKALGDIEKDLRQNRDYTSGAGILGFLTGALSGGSFTG